MVNVHEPNKRLTDSNRCSIPNMLKPITKSLMAAHLLGTLFNGIFLALYILLLSFSFVIEHTADWA